MIRPGDEISSPQGGILILEELGSGGMGRLYLASQVSMRRNVALELLPPDLIPDGEMRARFLRETRILTALHHPNLVGVLDAGIHHDTPWIAMELVEESTLQDLLDRHVELPLEKLVGLLLDLASALAYLHHAGVFHRDLRPENVLLTRDGRPRIANFGLARASGMTALAATLEVVGTVPFLAPESLTDAPAGPAVDVYALGLLAYWMAAGDMPYRGGSLAEWAQQIATVTPVTPRSKRPGLPPEVDQLVMSMLEKDPSRRPGAEEVHRRLEAIRSTGPLEREPSLRVSQTLAQITRRVTLITRSLVRARNHPAVVPLGLIMLLGMGMLVRDTEPPPIPRPPAALITPPPATGVLECHRAITDRWLFVRIGLASPLAIRLVIEDRDRPPRVVEDGILRHWHRHDVPVEPGRDYTLNILASTPGARLCLTPVRMTSLTIEEMSRRAEAAVQSLELLGAGAGIQGTPDLTDGIEKVFGRNHPFEWTAQGQEHLARRMGSVAWFERPALAATAGLGSGEGPAHMLRRAASVRTRAGIEGDQPERFRASPLPMVTALCLRGGEEDLLALETFLTEEMGSGGLPAADRLVGPMTVLAEKHPERAAAFSARSAGRWPLLSAFLDARLPGSSRERTRAVIASGNSDLRHMALTGLLLAPPSPDLAGLLEAWKEEPATRQEAILGIASLGLAGSTESRARLIRLASRAGPADITAGCSFLRAIAMSALGNLGEPGAREAITRGVSDPSPEVRRAALGSQLSLLVHDHLRPVGRALPESGPGPVSLQESSSVTEVSPVSDLGPSLLHQLRGAPGGEAYRPPVASMWAPVLQWLEHARAEPPPDDLGQPDEECYQVLDLTHLTRATGLVLECGDLVEIQGMGLIFAPPPVGDGAPLLPGRDFSYEARFGAQRRPVPLGSPAPSTRYPITSPGPLLLSAHLHLRTPQGLLTGGIEGVQNLSTFLIARIRTWRSDHSSPSPSPPP